MGALRGPRGRLFVDADDLGEVSGGEAVCATDPRVRYQAPARPVLDPPDRAAERLGDLLGAVEAGQGCFALGAGKRACESRGCCGVAQEGWVPNSVVGVLGQRR